VDARDKGGRTPLHEAAETNNADVVELLLASGVNVDAQDDDGKTPLQVAKEKESEAAIRLLEGKPS
jgi:uncharacterized protein